ncbi:MAG: trigger factor [Candidatus Nomurabacteria bacterium]|jgi:trigger factor|nr:trigger factor [Candidatus Nomurabacteria bacterium]
MKSEVKQLDGGRVEVKIVLDKAEIAEAHKEAVEILAKSVKVKGFRAGKAPLYAAERQLNPNALMQKAADIMVKKTLFPAVYGQKIALSSQPEVEITKFVPAETFEYKATADLMPDVKLGDYKNLKVKREKIEKIDEKEIDEFVKSMAGRNRDWKVVERAAKNGDRAVIDFLGTENGEPFAGGEGKEYPLELGSNTFVPGFEEQIVGHKAGDKFVIDITFPKQYHPQMAGKQVQFEVKIHKIEEAGEVKVDDVLAEKMGFKSLDEFKAEVRKNRERVAESENEDKFLDALVQELVKKSKIMVPQGVIDRIAHELQHQSPEAAEDLLQAQAKSRAEMLAVLNALADEIQITVTDEELAAQLDALKVQNMSRPELVRQLSENLGVQEDIRARMRLDKVAAELRKMYSK